MISKLPVKFVLKLRQIFPELWPFAILAFKPCQQAGSKMVFARDLKLGQLIGNDE